MSESLFQAAQPVENLLSSAIIYCFYKLEDGPCDSCMFQLSWTCGFVVVVVVIVGSPGGLSN